MLKKIFNECRFKLSITTDGPLLVKSGHAHVTGPDMTPVRTYRGGELEVFIPGSSLKGVFRSHIEKVIRTLNEGIVCSPFVETADKCDIENGDLVCPEYSDVFCGDKFQARQQEEIRIDGRKWKNNNQEKELSSNTEAIYSDSCPVCRLFGSTYFIGRISIGDAYLKEGQKGQTEERDGVGIDRFTGGSSKHAKFELEVVSSGTTFETDVYLRNFETWQLGMMMLLLQDLEDGLIRIGSGTSRGLGAVKGNVEELTISYIGLVNDKTANEVWGIGKFLNDCSYGTDGDDDFSTSSSPSEEEAGIRRIATYESDSLDDVKQEATENFVSRIQKWQVPDSMKFEHLQLKQVGG